MTRLNVLITCFLFLFSSQLFSQNNIKTDKKEIFFNNYDKKYYHKGIPFSGIMKSDFNEIAFKEGIPHGLVKSYNEQGRLYRSLNYIDGKFEGDFFTEKYKGTFHNDILIGTFDVFDHGKLDRKYSFLINDNSPSKESFSYYDNGKIEMKGILMYKYEMSSSDIGIGIGGFIKGDNFNQIRHHANLPEMKRNEMYFYSSFFKNGQISHKQIVKDSSFTGYVQYYQNGIISDSLVSLLPLNLYEVSPNNYLKSVRNRDYYQYNEQGKLIKKNTQVDKEQSIPDKKDDDNNKQDNNKVIVFQLDAIEADINEPEKSIYGEVSHLGKFIGEYFEAFDNGLPKYKWFFNENGILNGEYLEYYDNGKLKIKTSLTNGKVNPFIDYYRENGTKRLSIFKLNEEYIFQDYFIDGNVKLKHKIDEENVEEFLGRLSSLLRITGHPTIEKPLISEDSDLSDLL